MIQAVHTAKMYSILKSVRSSLPRPSRATLVTERLWHPLADNKAAELWSPDYNSTKMLKQQMISFQLCSVVFKRFKTKLYLSSSRFVD